MVDTYATPFLFDWPSCTPAWHYPGDHPHLVRKPHDPGHIHENRLECVETDHWILVVGCQHQKDNAGDQADQIAQCRSHIVSHRARYLHGGTGRGGRRRPYLTPALGTKTSFYRGTARRAKRHLCSSYQTLMCTTPNGKCERDIRRSMSRRTEHKLRN